LESVSAWMSESSLAILRRRLEAMVSGIGSGDSRWRE
jgi:hypothetical protein